MTAAAPGGVGGLALADAIAPEPAPSGAGSRTLRVRQEFAAWAGLIPFFAFLGLFLVVPTISVFRRALQHSKGSTVPAMREAITGQFQHYFIESLRVSALSAVIGGLLGALLALVVVQLRRPRWLRTMVTAFSGVSANMGGVILAFIFIASLGVQGVGTKILGWLPLVGFKLPPDFITSDAGLITVYLYFQIPLMFLVMLPAIDGLKPAWREAVSNLGGTSFTYWRRVGIPVLAPAALGGLLLLFANAFAAYATAYALTTQAGELVPVQIRFYLQGNTITGKANVGYALAAWMVLIMLVTIGLYLLVRRRSERWSR